MTDSKRVVAIIGSRSPTQKQKDAVAYRIEKLDPTKDRIISGCADGVDALALRLAFEQGFETIGMLPWASYNEQVHVYCHKLFVIDELDTKHVRDARKSVEKYHPAPERLSQGVMKLMMRNYGIIRWAAEVYAFPSNAPGGGGTGQGIRLAKGLNIPVHTIHP